MNINMHIPLYLGSSLFNRLPYDWMFRLFKLPFMRDCVGLDQSLALLTLCVVCFAVLSKEGEQKRLLVTVCGTGQVTPGEGNC